MMLLILGLFGILLAVVNVFIAMTEGNLFFLIFVLFGSLIGIGVYGPKGPLRNSPG